LARLSSDRGRGGRFRYRGGEIRLLLIPLIV
jgi:hypothetical protein